jgi:hypothetical protein
MVMSLAGQAYQDDTRNRYQLLTWLDAPVASRDDRVRVTVASVDQGLLNRVWRVLDLSQAQTLAIVRTTWMDEVTQSTHAAQSGPTPPF